MDATKGVVMDQHKRIEGATLFLNQRNKNYPVFKGLNTIGRNKSAVVDIKELSISQFHAIIVIVDDNQHFLSDLNSSNGTFLHGTKLVPFKLYELTHSADITFGNISGQYLKPSHGDTTVHLNVTDSIDMTQNMTQNFYAATTQLMFDITSSDHEFVRPKSRNNQSPMMPSQPVKPSSIGSTHSSESILEENIHDIATQVVEYPEKLSVVVDPIQYEAVENSIVDSNIHDQPTQVVVLPQSMKTTQDNIETVDKSENKVNVVSTQVTEPASKDASETGTSKIEHSVAVVIEIDIHKNSNVPESQIDSQTTNIDGDEDYMKNLKVQNVNSCNTLHSSQIPSTSGNGQTCEVNDSLVSNPSSDNVIVEETMMDENLDENSNGSVDLLTMPANYIEDNEIVASASPNKHEKLSQSDGSSEDIVKSKKKQPIKLPSDSGTDCDETQDIGSRKRPTVRINSDSETDCEDNVPDEKKLSQPEEPPDTPTQNIKPVVKSKKMNFDSDSDTDVENEDNIGKKYESKNNQYGGKATNSDSDDTDIEDCKPEENQPKKYSMKNHLNDSDCIPATQDAFAEAFKYKSHLEDNCGHQSSEESFKLGLTELMVDDEHSRIQIVEQTCIAKNVLKEEDIVSMTSYKGIQSEDKNDGTDSLESSNKKTYEINLKDYKENIYDLPTQTDEENIKCTETVSKLSNEDTFQENLMDQSDDFILPTQNLCFPNKDSLNTIKHEEPLKTKSSSENNTEKPEIYPNKDIYDLPTQNLCSRSQDKLTEQSEDFVLATQKLPDVCVDEYMMPTQKINSESQFKVPAKKFTFKKKPVVLEDSMSKILGSDNDDEVYMAATQKMDSSEPSNNYKSDCKINQKIDGKEDDDAYIQPTQCINVENKNVTPSAEEDVYVLATQQLEYNTTTNDISKGNNVNLEIEDTFSLPTQVISNEVNSNSQLELIAITENINMPPPPDVHRPTNPLNHILNLNKIHSELPSSSKRINLDRMPAPNQKRIKTSKFCQLRMKTEDVETLSQIEAFVNKPFIKSENDVKDNKNSSTASLTDKRDDIEIKTRHSKELEKTSFKTSANIINMQNDAETLSQIEAFIKNPTEEVQELSKSKKNLKKKIDVTKPQNAAELHISKDDVVTNMIGTKKLVENVEDNFEKSKTTVNDTTETDLMENSTDFGKDSDIRSDIDTSFALLESKITKVKRNSRMHADLGQIIAIPLNRRSMAIAETSTIAEVQDTLPSRKSRRITGNNIQQTKPKATLPSRKSRRITGNNIQKTTPKAAPNKSVAESLSSDIPSKKSRISIQEKKFSGLVDIGMPTKGKRSSASRDVQSHTSIDEFSTPTRHQGNDTLDSLTSSIERAKRKQKHKIVFTMMDSPNLESCIRQLGGFVVDSVDSSTVLITQQVKRSQKLLAAVGQGKPVCSPEWIEASKKNRDFLDPWDFILVDKEAESRWDFSLKESLQRASQTKLLRNYSFQIMVSNAVEVLKSAIESCGGKVLSRNPGKKLEGTFVIIASPEHKNKYSKSLKQHPGVKIVEPEAIFDGVLRQELRLSKHLLI